MRAKPAVVKGEPRSLVKTNGDLGSCPRCSLRTGLSPDRFKDFWRD